MESPYPSATVETPFGPVTVLGHGLDRAMFFAERDRPLTINHVPYSGSVRLARIGGVWTATDRYIRKVDRGWNDEYPSESARRKIEEVLIPTMVAWLDAHPDVLLQGEVAVRRAEVEKAQADLTEIEGQLAAAEEKLAQAARAFREASDAQGRL